MGNDYHILTHFFTVLLVLLFLTIIPELLRNLHNEKLFFYDSVPIGTNVVKFRSIKELYETF